MNTTITPPAVVKSQVSIGGGARINDDETRADRTWSSEKIAEEIANASGGPGGTGDLKYQHNQAIPSDTWVVNHNLNKFPAVTVIDSAGNVCEGDLDYDNANTLTLTFSAAFAGTAYLN